MLERNDVLSIPYLKKTSFSGSYQGMRFLMRMEKGDEDTKLHVCCWEETYSYEATKDEDKVEAEFEFSEDGIKRAVDWLNDRWKEHQDEYKRAGEHWDLS